MNELFVGLPFLINTSWTAGKIYDTERSDFYVDGSKLDIQYGVYVHEWQGQFFSIHKSLHETFYGARYTSTDANGAVEAGHFGQYVWKKESDDSSHWQLHSAIQDLSNKTGLGNLLMVNIPTQTDMDYTSATFTMTLSQDATDRLLSYVDGSSKEEFGSRALGLLDAYFADNRDPAGLCPSQATPERCRYIVKEATTGAIQKMWEDLGKMRDTLATDARQFSTAYADFGQAMLTNQFTFQTGLALARQGVEIDYVLEGTTFSKYELDLVSDANGNFTVQSAPSGTQWALGNSFPIIHLPEGIVAAPHGPFAPIPAQ
jgi:hypothetical protein